MTKPFLPAGRQRWLALSALCVLPACAVVDYLPPDEGALAQVRFVDNLGSVAALPSFKPSRRSVVSLYPDANCEFKENVGTSDWVAVKVDKDKVVQQSVGFPGYLGGECSVTRSLRLREGDRVEIAFDLQQTNAMKLNCGLTATKVDEAGLRTPAPDVLGPAPPACPQAGARP